MRDAHWNRTPERREAARKLGLASRTHGASRRESPLHATYRSWQAMKRRCDSPRDTFYARYGGRGIGYDPRWQSFETFLADMGQRPVGTSLDRIDNDGPYALENCRWATLSEQRRNRQQPRGWKQRSRRPAVYGVKQIACMDGCGVTSEVMSIVSRWRCRDCDRKERARIQRNRRARLNAA